MKNSNSLEHALHVVKRVLESGSVLTDPYDQWVTVGMACTEFGEQGRQLFHDLSRMSSKYDQRATDRKYDELLRTSRGQVRFATVAHMAKNAGVDLSVTKDNSPRSQASRKKAKALELSDTVSQIKAILQERFDFRFNVFKERVEFSPRKSHKWQPLDERSFKTLLAEFISKGLAIDKSTFDTIISDRNFSPDFHPVRHYLQGLTEWDGETDYIQELFDRIIFKDEAERTFAMPLLRKWFVTLVALALGKTLDNQLMPMFIGAENIGKTYLAKNILPPALRAYCKVMTPDEKFDKDSYISLSEFILIIFDEFRLTGRNSGSMKAYISMSDTNIRSPYAQRKEERARRASVMGTGNDVKYIKEYEGNRRYLSISMKGSKNLKESPIDYDGAFAQALAIISKGDYQYSLSVEETAAIKAHNEEFMLPDDCEEAIGNCFRLPEEGEKGVAMSASDIFREIKPYVAPSTVVAQVGKALRKKFTPRIIHGRTKYYVILKDFNAIKNENNLDAIDIRNEIEKEQQRHVVADGDKPIDGCPF